MMEPLVSIITPVYNAGCYITDCINSVEKQSYTNWELILIDDGSTDGSPGMLDAFASMDSRVRVVHTKNKGVSHARNLGIYLSKGKYIVFLDADDKLTEDSLKIRVVAIQGAQLTIANYTVMGGSDPVQCSDRVWDKELSIQSLFIGKRFGYQGYLWNKLFMSDIIKNNGIWFRRGIAYNEDRLFCYMYMQYIDRTTISNEVVYEYRKTDSSAMGKIAMFSDADERKVMSEFKAFDLMVSTNRRYSSIILKEEYSRAITLLHLLDNRARKIKKRLLRITIISGMKYLQYDKEMCVYDRVKFLLHLIIVSCVQVIEGIMPCSYGSLKC